MDFKSNFVTILDPTYLLDEKTYISSLEISGIYRNNKNKIYFYNDFIYKKKVLVK